MGETLAVRLGWKKTLPAQIYQLLEVELWLVIEEEQGDEVVEHRAAEDLRDEQRIGVWARLTLCAGALNIGLALVPFDARARG